MEMILFLQYALSVSILAVVFLGLSLLKQRLLQLSVRLSEKSRRMGES